MEGEVRARRRRPTYRRGVTRRPARLGLPLVAVLATVLAGCAATGSTTASDEASRSAATAGPSPAEGPPGSRAPSDPDAARVTAQPRTRAMSEPRRSSPSIPALGLGPVPVVRYRGRPDDARGTRIQNGGPAASPRGPGGGVGPGEVGNFIVTGHRTSHSAPFRELPDLRAGDQVRVRSGRWELVYRVTATRRTSFRSPRSLAEQAAPVPGRPGASPSRPMITLSTCATPEDHAVGNYWSDRFGNPEHRIDKIGVLVRQTRVDG